MKTQFANENEELVLSFFSEQQGFVVLKDLRKKSGLDWVTAEFLESLVSRGFLEKGSDGGFILSEWGDGFFH